MAKDVPTSPAPETPSGDSRTLPSPRATASKPGAKRRKYLRYKRLATLGLLVVVLAAAFYTVKFVRDQQDGGEERATRALMDDLAKALEQYYARKKRLPTRVAQLLGPDSPYQGGPIAEDAWRHVIQYRVIDGRAGEWRLRSWGADGRAGTEDDIIYGGETWPPGEGS